MKRTGKGLDLTDKYTNHVNKFKHALANVSEGVPVVEWKPYKPPRAMEDAIARCKELTALPSRFP